MSQHTGNEDEETVTPRRLELSLSPEDGSLMTAPLSTVLLAATNGLYSDLYDMAHGELDVAQPQLSQQQAQDDSEDESPLGIANTKKKERMSNLSFAQRRHELAYRIAQHGRSLEKVAALTAAATAGNLGHNTKVATKALQHARTAWVQADEAQDALYFFHARLFPARQAPHDVLGALDVIKSGQWKDLPEDLRLKMDRYDSSPEQQWSPSEVADRWQMAVREKLIRGEVGKIQRQKLSDGIPQPLWRVSLRGGVVRLTHGVPRVGTSPPIYPLEANVSVLSTLPNAEWTLLSVEVRAKAKTGESNHQLDTSLRQRFDLHRLCALAMTREEMRAREEKEKEPRPLDALFQVAHTFSLSWQLEILSAQAQALRKGVWSAADSSSGLAVMPVQFRNNTHSSVLGEMSIYFWSVDDRYGPPAMGDLSMEGSTLRNTGDQKQDDAASVTTSSSVNRTKTSHKSPKGQLTLTIRAESHVGMCVCLSGGDAIMESMQLEDDARATVEQLLDATSNPFSLSASDALLAATRLAAERKCHAITQALQPADGASGVLPSWIHLSVNRGSISVAARVSYHSGKATINPQSREFLVLFRLACDSRTGSFVATFSRSTTLLRLLACNHLTASDVVAIRSAKLAQNRRKAVSHGTGRFVREAFDGLTRSMNVLGQRTGVGGTWEDLDNKSASLRQRLVQLACADVRNSLMTCCGYAAVYGLSALAMGVSTGVSATVDIAGGSLDNTDEISFVPAPPLSVILDQQMIQKEFKNSDGEKKIFSLLERDLFSVSCAVTNTALTLYAFDVTMQMDSPSAAQHDRLACALVTLQPSSVKATLEHGKPGDGGPKKRARVDANGAIAINGAKGTNGDKCGPTRPECLLLDEVENLASIFSNTLDSSE